MEFNISNMIDKNKNIVVLLQKMEIHFLTGVVCPFFF